MYFLCISIDEAHHVFLVAVAARKLISKGHNQGWLGGSVG